MSENLAALRARLAALADQAGDLLGTAPEYRGAHEAVIEAALSWAGKELAELGTLRARLAEVERQRDGLLSMVNEVGAVGLRLDEHRRAVRDDLLAALEHLLLWVDQARAELESDRPVWAVLPKVKARVHKAIASAREAAPAAAPAHHFHDVLAGFGGDDVHDHKAEVAPAHEEQRP